MSRKVPSLYDIASKSVPFKSWLCQDVFDDAAKKRNIDLDTLEFLQEKELAHIDAKGRIPGSAKLSRESVPQINKRKRHGDIDGARLEDYDPLTRSIKIRMDDSDNLAFWAELTLSLDDLKDWLAIQGVTASFSYPLLIEEEGEGV